MSDTIKGKNNFLRGLTDPTMIFSVMLVTIVLMLIIPIPSVLLDVLMILSILSGIMVVLTVAYSRSTTDFTVFPTVLLVTTILGLHT